MEQQRISNAVEWAMKGEPVMKLRRSNCILRAMVSIIFAVCVTSIALAQEAKPTENKDTTQQLLTEVRMLRQALEAVQRISLDTYRSQLLVDRVRASREEIRR